MTEESVYVRALGEFVFGLKTGEGRALEEGEGPRSAKTSPVRAGRGASRSPTKGRTGSWAPTVEKCRWQRKAHAGTSPGGRRSNRRGDADHRAQDRAEARLVSCGCAEDGGRVARVVDEASGRRTNRDDDACVTPVWTGSAANGFQDRALSLRQGVATTRAAIGRARGALETSASAYGNAVVNANHYIGFWRNRPTLPPVIEDLFARVVNARLLSVGVTYNQHLAGVSAVLTGDDVDLDELDEDTRDWVEKGLAKNDDWLGGNDSSLGPLIPNPAATGDGRGLIPQGLGYVPGSGSQTGPCCRPTTRETVPASL